MLFSDRVKERTIVLLNLVLVRVDAFLQNFFDFLYIVAYTIVLSSTISPIKSKIEVRYITIIPFAIHILYSLTYIISDYIDYHRDIGKAENIQLWSFYRYRPICYFKKTRTIFTYLIILYFFYVLLFFIVLRLPVFNNLPLLLITIFLISSLAIIHSLSGDRSTIKLITFSSQRLLKYAIYVFVADKLLALSKHSFNIIIMTSLIIPYTIYNVLKYNNTKEIIKINKIPIMFAQASVTLISATIFAISIITYRAIPYRIADIVKAIILAHLATTTPLMIVKIYLSIKLGSKNENFYMHVKRLVFGAIAAIVLLYAIKIFLSSSHKPFF